MYHNYNTRGAEHLCTPSHKLSVFERNPVYMGILIYNKLPEHLKHCYGLKSLKVTIIHFYEQISKLLKNIKIIPYHS